MFETGQGEPLAAAGEIQKEKTTKVYKKARHDFMRRLALFGVTLTLFQVADSNYPIFHAAEITQTLHDAEKSKEMDVSIFQKEGKNLDVAEIAERDNLNRSAENIDQILGTLDTKGSDYWISQVLNEDKAGSSQDSTCKLAYDIVNHAVGDHEKTLFETPEKADYPATEIEGFESIGISNEVVKSFIGELLPPRIQNCTSRIEFIKPQIYPNGQSFKNQDDPRWRFEIYTGDMIDWSKGINQLVVKNFIAHESAHNCDWERNPYLSLADKIQFLSKILTRLKDEDRLRSSYVDKIKSLDRKPEKWTTPYNVIRAAEEYWAEIFALYISGSTDRTRPDKDERYLPDEDRRIVEWVIARTDPNWLSKKGVRLPEYSNEGAGASE